MRVGSLVRHIEWEYIGVVIQQDNDCDKWLVHYYKGKAPYRWCSECELEVLCV